MSADELENRNFPARLVTVALGVALLVAICCVPVHAQDDVAEAARQARERKAAQQNSPRHVYTDDDLKKTRILTPEDTSRAVASRKVPATHSQPQIEVTTIEQAKQPEQHEKETSSLGEIARRYRLEREIKQAEQAAKSGQPSRYPLDLPKTSFAEPKPIAPSRGSLYEDELHAKKPGFPTLLPGFVGTRVAPYAPHHDVIDRSFATAPLATVIASLQRKQVQAGENWWRLAQKYLGYGARWPELRRINPGVGRNPNRLLVGTFIFVPGSLKTGTGPSGREIAVRPGDTLWSVARDQLGCANAWPKLAAANPQVTNFRQLQIGRKLRLPETALVVCSVSVKADSRN